MPDRIRQNQNKTARFSDYLGNYMFILPTILLFSAFSLYPILRTVQLSLFKWDGMSPMMEWVGLRNFYVIFKYDKTWWLSMWNAVKFALIAVTVMQSFSLLLAYLVERGAKLQNFYKVVYYIPTILSAVVVGYIWKWIYDPNGGILNFFLKSIGLEGLTRAWLSDPFAAFYAVSFASMWAGFGYSFLLFLAALKGISPEIYESAKVDGANNWQIMWRLIIPMLRPILTIVSILTILGAMQLFALIVVTTNGGPGFATEVPVMTIYRVCFQDYHYGYACALSLIFGLTLLVISMAQMELSKHYDI